VSNKPGMYACMPGLFDSNWDEIMKNVCKATGRGRVPANFVGERPYDIKLKLEAEFDKYYDMVVFLSRSKRLTIPAIKTMITGVGDEILKSRGNQGF